MARRKGTRSGRRHLSYSPEVILAAHYANPTFRDDLNAYLTEAEAVKTGTVAGDLEKLAADFRRRYPHFSLFSPNAMGSAVLVIPYRNPYDDPTWKTSFLRVLAGGKGKPPDSTCHLFPESLPVHTLDGGASPPFNLFDREDPVDAVPVTSPNSDFPVSEGGRIGRYLRLQVDLNHDWENLKAKLIKVVKAYREELRKKAAPLGRRREAALLESLRLAQCNLMATRQGKKPHTIVNPTRYRKRTSQNQTEWDDLTKRFSRARNRAEVVFRELGLPLSK